MLVLAGLTGGCSPGAPPAATPEQTTTASQPTTPQPVARQVEVRLTCATGDDEAPCAFRPDDVSVSVGGVVRWVNDDATFHTVTSTASPQVRRPSGRFHGVLDRTGETFTVRFAEEGTYAYYCQPHAEFMAGIVRVVPE
ncbi:copper binding plastocyanin/azurin family protein [Kribbella sp. VKM Ac-2527]|uniref:Copper binding plastocyanin/azurin family protein n=2 Tax=Kribbella caucasensis TaxID=2512215 RepID=A0A4R6J4W4_9ACTN|nr:copper binding plastocyanin/azurin family protein [Kribbella sp. VKM Ac-2527]